MTPSDPLRSNTVAIPKKSTVVSVLPDRGGSGALVGIAARVGLRVGEQGILVGRGVVVGAGVYVGCPGGLVGIGVGEDVGMGVTSQDGPNVGN